MSEILEELGKLGARGSSLTNLSDEGVGLEGLVEEPELNSQSSHVRLGDHGLFLVDLVCLVPDPLCCPQVLQLFLRKRAVGLLVLLFPR